MATKQTNIVANPARGLVFFEGEDLAYNYQTDQWSKVSAYDTYGLYSINDKAKDIGLVVYSSGSVDLQDQLDSYVPQTATLETGSIDVNKFGRAIVNGIRPLVNGGTYTVYAGSKDSLTENVDYSTATSVNSRTGYANFRKEGRYVAAKVEIASGFNQALGLDVNFANGGKV